MKHAEILHRCFRCGYCKLPGSYQDLNCPSYLKYRFETYSPGGRMWLLRAWLDGEIKPGPRLQEILFSCVACRNCVEHCVFPRFKADLLNAFIAAREELVNLGTVPAGVADYLKAESRYGNPYKAPEDERGKWAQGLDLRPYDGQDYLLVAGCVGAYDERGQRMARAVAGVLARRGVSFGILGSAERCDGNEVRVLGEAGLFEQMARQNLEGLLAAGVKKIITVSPHGYHALKNLYPLLGAAFQVFHYSQVLAMTAAKGPAGPGTAPLKVTFHDPCYLGRHNQDYFTPRVALAAVPGLELSEMDRNKADALCCGGGGGNFFTDVLGPGPDSAARVRIREAAATGADVLAVACPHCAKMLEDAAKAEDLDGRLRVMDLAEIILERSA